MARSGGAALLVGADQRLHQVAERALDLRVGQLAVDDRRMDGRDTHALLEGYGARDAEHLLGLLAGSVLSAILAALMLGHRDRFHATP